MGDFAETPGTEAPQERTRLTSEAQPRPPSLQQVHRKRDPTAQLSTVIVLLNGT